MKGKYDGYDGEARWKHERREEARLDAIAEAKALWLEMDPFKYWDDMDGNHAEGAVGGLYTGELEEFTKHSRYARLDQGKGWTAATRGNRMAGLMVAARWILEREGYVLRDRPGVKLIKWGE